MDKTEDVLLWAHHEKRVLFGKGKDTGKSRRQQKKRKIKSEMD